MYIRLPRILDAEPFICLLLPISKIPATEHAGRGYDYYYGGWRYLENRAGVSRKSIRLSSGKTLMGVFLVG